MTWMEVFSLVDCIIQMVVLSAAIVAVIHQLNRRGSSVVLGFFLYALICWLLGDIYYTAMSVLKPDVRIPFGVGEIADMGVFSLMATMLYEAFRPQKVKAAFELFLTVIFSLSMIVLWIAWSGEWIKDIVGGIPYGFYMCIVILSAKKSGAFRSWEQCAIGFSAFTVLTCQSLVFFLPKPYSVIVDDIAYGIMIVGIVCLLIKNARMLRKGLAEQTPEAARAALATACFSFIWILNCMYGSYEPLYTAEDLTYTIMAVIATRAVILTDECSRFEAAEQES